jgi:hypothetical protein
MNASYLFFAWVWCGLVVDSESCSAPICRVAGEVYFETAEACEHLGRITVEEDLSAFYRVQQIHGGCSEART